MGTKNPAYLIPRRMTMGQYSLSKTRQENNNLTHHCHCNSFINFYAQINNSLEMTTIFVNKTILDNIANIKETTKVDTGDFK